jgi:hypothetical protein
MVRSLILLLLGAIFVAGASGERGTLDPAFEKIPFDRWLGEREQAPFHWTATVPRAELSFHQRLMAHVEIKLDGRDLETRRGNGQLMFFVQITDGDGTRYQDHSHIELNKLDENIRNAYLEFSQRAFFLPGDFRVAVVILDTATGEHGARQMQFRVAPTQHQLLPGVWRDLPPVEFVSNQESPASWYLPDIRGRLQLVASVHSQARLNVILNVALSAPARGSRPAPSGDLAALLPTLKAISQTGSSSLSEHVELLDLSRRRAVFQQNEVHDLDWPRLKASLEEANTASIDVHFGGTLRSGRADRTCSLRIRRGPGAHFPRRLDGLPRGLYPLPRACARCSPWLSAWGPGSGFAHGRASDPQPTVARCHRSVGGYPQASKSESIRCLDARTDGESPRRYREGASEFR